MAARADAVEDRTAMTKTLDQRPPRAPARFFLHCVFCGHDSDLITMAAGARPRCARCGGSLMVEVDDRPPLPPEYSRPRRRPEDV